MLYADMSRRNQFDHCLIFYHIEKTAGTTFNDILERQYKPRFTYHLHGRRRREELADFKKFSEEVRASYRCITGHMSHLLAEYVPTPIKYVTFLRDPMSQVISSYNYTKNIPRTKAHDRIKNLKSIDKYFDWQIEDSRDNIQTRYLANVTRFMEGKTGKIDMQKDGQKYAEIAKKRLSEIDHVFITEEFDQSLLILKKSLGWNKNVYYRRRNISEHREKLTTAQKNRIRDVFKYDFELYELAKQRHQVAVENYSGNLEESVKNFRKINRYAGPVVSVIRPEHWIRTAVHHGRNKGLLPG